MRSQPPSPQTQCASGSYTTRLQSTAKARYAANFIRSTTAPEISATVIAANIA